MTSNTDILSGFMAALGSGAIKVVDLAHPLGPDTPMIVLPKGHGRQPPKVSLEYLTNYAEDGGFSRWSVLTTAEHAGTHFDTPSHWVTGKDYPDGATDTIGVERFIAPACVVDCEAEVAADPDFILTAERLEQWEAEHGRIPAGNWLFLRSGWCRRYDDPAAFINHDDEGNHSPGPNPDAVRLMIERDVCGYGTETVGTDQGMAGQFEPKFPAHFLMHGANKFGMSSLNNLDQLPATGAVVITAPLKIKNGSGSPLRALALVAA
jgi:kynurenine formamidase